MEKYKKFDFEKALKNIFHIFQNTKINKKMKNFNFNFFFFFKFLKIHQNFLNFQINYIFL